MKFLLKWRPKDDRLSGVGTIPPNGAPIDEIADTGSAIKLLGHWCEDGRGTAIVEAQDAETVYERTLAWHRYVDLDLCDFAEED
ncbi:MAG: DUF3303 family protein [Planctomycetota bacterium]